MGRLVTRRLLTTVPTVFLVTLFVFSLILIVPGDPAAVLLGQEGSAEHLAGFRRELGLDRPIPVQYARWFTNAVRGNLGRSIRSGEKVTTEIRNRYEVTLELTLGSILVSLLIAIPIGVYSAVRPYTIADHVGTVFAIGGVALPSFWLAILLIYLFAVILGWLPASGYIEPWQDPWGNLQRMVLPVAASGTAGAASIMRQTRSAMLEVLRQDYIRTAYSKGLSERLVLIRHALKNASIPILTVIGLHIIVLLEGTAVLETMFGLPGLGQFAVGAAKTMDLPAVQGALLAFGAIVIVTNFGVDLLYGYLDPRIRYS